MKKKDFLPIILGSDENAYGTARLFREAYPEVTPLLVCTAQLIPTRHSRLFDCRIIASFEREEVFPDALLGVLRECSKDYEKLLVIPCSDYYTGLLCRHYDHFEGLIANRFIPEQLLETFDTKDRFYALCEQYGMDYPKTSASRSPTVCRLTSPSSSSRKTPTRSTTCAATLRGRRRSFSSTPGRNTSRWCAA